MNIELQNFEDWVLYSAEIGPVTSGEGMPVVLTIPSSLKE
jgi:hypothetical protein